MSLAKGANKNVIKPVNNKQIQTDNKKKEVAYLTYSDKTYQTTCVKEPCLLSRG